MKKKQRATVQAQLNIELNCHCPHCGQWIDVWEAIEPEDRPEIETAQTDIIVGCPDCEEVFTIIQVNY